MDSLGTAQAEKWGLSDGTYTYCPKMGSKKISNDQYPAAFKAAAISSLHVLKSIRDGNLYV